MGFSIRPSPRQLKSILMRRANSEYVCMSEAPEHVCMSLSNLQNLLVSEGVKFLTKNVQYLITNSIFEICEGGYFWRPQKTTRMYVCQVCMFAMHVCMFAKLVCMFAKLVCMCVCQCTYVWEKSCPRGRGSIPYKKRSVFVV